MEINRQLYEKMIDAAFTIEEINSELSKELGEKLFPIDDFRLLNQAQEKLVEYADSFAPDEEEAPANSA